MTISTADRRIGRSRILASLAGPTLVLAGSLIVLSQLAVWPLRRGSIVAVATSPVYVVAMIGFLVGTWVLLIGVFAVHARQAQQAGTFGLVALAAAAVGIAHMGANIWFDTFVVPWLARQIPAALDVPRDGTLVVGALLSYLMLVVGWTLFGIACLRARVIPRTLAIGVIASGPVAYVFLPPNTVVFGAVVLALGVWLARHRPSTADVE
jgi:hypothetical protein